MSIEKSIIKTSVDTTTKVKFKTLCIQKQLTISRVLEEIIEDVLNTDRYIPRDLKFESQNMQIVKAYISQDLKLRFKIFCAERQIPMNYILRFLIQNKIKTEDKIEQHK